MDEPSSPEGNAITLRIKFKSASLDEFVSRYGADVSAGGIFIRTKQPLAVGALLRFDFTLADGTPLMAGLGTVVWIREPDASRAGSIPGMGLRFDQLTPEGTQTHKQILAAKERRPGGSAPSPSAASPAVPVARPPVRPATPPPITARRVAPAVPAPPTPIAPFPLAPAPAVAPPVVAKQSGEFDEFGGSGKTEIADRPPSFYFDNLGGTSGRKAEEAAPLVPLDDTQTDSQSLPVPDPSWSGAIDLSDESGAAAFSAGRPSVDTTAPELPRIPSLDTTASELPSVGGEGDQLASETLDLPFDASDQSAPVTDLPPGPSAGNFHAPLAPTSEQNWLDRAMNVTPEPSPVETAPERREGVQALPDSTLEEAKALGADDTVRPAFSDMEGAQELPDPMARKSGGQGKKLIVVGIVAAGLAFGGVYLLQTKPWQKAPVVQPEPTPEPSPTAPPLAPKIGEPSQPVAVPPPAEKAAEPAKAAEPVKPAARTPQEESAKAKPTEAEAAAGTAKNPGSAGAGKKTPGRSAPVIPASSPTSAPSPSLAAASAAAETTKTAEEIYLLKVKSTPPGGRVAIDGEPMGPTPFQRRILEVDKPHVVRVTKPGYEMYEHTVVRSDAWARSGNTSTLVLSVKLAKTKNQPSPSPSPSPSSEPAPVEAVPAVEQPEKL